MANFPQHYNDEFIAEELYRYEKRVSDINKASTQIQSVIQSYQDEMKYYNRDQAVYNKLNDVVQPFNEMIELVEEKDENIAMLKDTLHHFLFDIEGNRHTLFLPSDLSNTLKEKDAMAIQYYNALIEILQKYYEDVNEFLQEAERLREEGKDEEAEVYENRVKFIGWLTMESDQVLRELYHEELMQLCPWNY